MSIALKRVVADSENYLKLIFRPIIPIRVWFPSCLRVVLAENGPGGGLEKYGPFSLRLTDSNTMEIRTIYLYVFPPEIHLQRTPLEREGRRGRFK